MIIYRYNKGSFNKYIIDMLKDKNRNSSDWEYVFYGGNTNPNFIFNSDIIKNVKVINNFVKEE